MITKSKENNDRFSQSSQSPNAYIEYITRLIKELIQKRDRILSHSKYSAEDKKQLNKLNEEIEYLELRQQEGKKMLSLPIGSWVRNGSITPGQIIDLKFAGQIPEVHVLWWNHTVPVPERPMRLTLLKDKDLEYIWNGDRYPKLVRRIDRIECEDAKIIDRKLTETAYQRACADKNNDDLLSVLDFKLTYCRKRIKFLSEPKRDRISIAAINRDTRTQQRAKLNHETVAEYAEAMKSGDKFPPVKLTYDGTNYWLTDGFHTTEAAWSIGQKFIEAEVLRGSLRDAVLASVAVNADHGLRRSNADKRKAVTTLLEDEEWSQWSNREIARRCKVSESLVRSIKNERSSLRLNAVTYNDKHGNVSTMHTENIGVAVSRDNEEILLNNNGELINQNGKPFDPQDWEDKTDDKGMRFPHPNVLTNLNRDSNCPDKESTVQISCPDKESTVQISSTDKPEPTGNQKLVEQFEIGQLVKLQLTNFEGASENLKLANHSYGQIIAPTENKCSLNVKVFGHKSFVVSPQDLKPVETVRFCVDFTPKQFIALMSIHSSRGGIEDAIKKGVLGK